MEKGPWFGFVHHRCLNNPARIGYPKEKFRELDLPPMVAYASTAEFYLLISTPFQEQLMGEKNLWEKYVTVEASIRALPQELRDLLNRHDAALLCTEWLKTRHPLESLRETDGEAVFQWYMVGMAFSSQRRWHEAISVQKELYELMCKAQEGHGWIHKGLPLVRLRDSHKFLGHPWHEERYLLLTLVEDAIRDEGKIILERSGIYHRFRWEDGRADAEFREISQACWDEFSKQLEMNVFPEEIIGRLGSNLVKRAAAQDETDLYEINSVYASRLYQKAAKADWKALEKLAAYELCCIPGFQVEVQKRTEASVFDVFIRLRGNYVDFRRELGAYMLGECKDWKKRVDPEVIAYLAQNLLFNECTAGILFSWNGVTGTEEMKFAALTVLRAYHHGGRVILVLDHDDFGKASSGEPLQEILRTKYEQVRFDLPAQNRD